VVFVKFPPPYYRLPNQHIYLALPIGIWSRLYLR